MMVPLLVAHALGRPAGEAMRGLKLGPDCLSSRPRILWAHTQGWTEQDSSNTNRERESVAVRWIRVGVDCSVMARDDAESGNLRQVKNMLMQASGSCFPRALRTTFGSHP